MSLVILALAALLGASPASAETIGRSADGRPITAARVGSPAAKRVILVVGVIHGNERAGLPVLRRLRGARPPRGTALLLVGDLNPDGSAAGTRQNGRGVDLSRNFPFAWRAMGKPFDTYHSGSGPLSEPESRAIAALIRRVRPRVTLYYHQMPRLVDRAGGDRFLERLYARRAGLPYRAHPPQPGSATRWQNQTFKRDTATVVELPAGSLSRRSVARHAGAVLALARAIAPPREVRRPIPFGEDRKAQMRDYARRHYAIDSFELKPRVIVQHHGFEQLRVGLQHVRLERTGCRVRGTARRVRPLPDRPRWHDRKARAHVDHVPPHGGAQSRGLRDRARRHQRRAGAGQPAPARSVAAPHPLTSGLPPDRHARRDRPLREPLAPPAPRASRPVQDRRTATSPRGQ